MPANLETCWLFVYGTLMPGYGNHQRIAASVRSAQPASIQGVLIDLGAFPALVPGNGLARGILLEITPDALRLTDALEGVGPDRGRSLYIRTQAAVRLDGGTSVQAWVYEFAQPQRIAARPPLVCGESEGVLVYAWPAERYKRL